MIAPIATNVVSGNFGGRTLGLPVTNPPIAKSNIIIKPGLLTIQPTTPASNIPNVNPPTAASIKSVGTQQPSNIINRGLITALSPPTAVGTSSLSGNNSVPTPSTPSVSTSNDGVLSHVSDESVFLTPAALSRGNLGAQGNMQGNTVPPIPFALGAYIKIQPKVGMVLADNPVSNMGNTKYSNTAPIPSFNSGSNFNSPKPAIDPATNPLPTGIVQNNNLVLTNPAITQNDVTSNPRTTVLATPNPNTLLGQNTQSSSNNKLGLIVIIAIVAAIIFGRLL